jgi:transcriptional regulator with XRE-family HTH domain
VRPRELVAKNLRAAMQAKPALSTIKKLADASGVPNGTVGRICNAQVNFGIDHLEAIAGALEMEPWELLSPFVAEERLDARNIVGNPARSGAAKGDQAKKSRR